VIPTILGVLNVTPDSFSDGGQHMTPQSAVARAQRMIDQGAAMIDVGGESTRPGATPVTIDEEHDRVVPVIEAIARLDAVVGGAVEISVDSRHAEVARAAVAAGASVINDVSAGLFDVAAELGVGWIAMHMAGEPGTMQEAPRYRDVVDEVLSSLVESARQGAEAGVERIWIDPGIGFGKTVEHNLALIAALAEFVATGVPVAVGLSRKSTMGVLTGRADGAAQPSDVGDRLEVSLALATWAMQCGVSLIRAHDVQSHVRAARVVAGQIEIAA
jgi:dihydropteroate synthase